MWYVEDRFEVKVGGNYYINVPNIIVYKGKSLFKMIRSDSDGLIGIEFDIYDNVGKKVATIRRGRIVDGDDSNYDIKLEHDHYSIREKKTNRLICDIRKREKANEVELELSVDLFTNDGFHLQADPDSTNLPGENLRGVRIENTPNGIVII